LVLDLHGRTLTKEDQRDYSEFGGLAEQEGFFVAWPDGPGEEWQAELSPAIRDIELLRALVAQLVSEYNIDPNRIYATGHSMGGGMVYRLACEAADLFAAFSIMAATVISTDVPKCNPSRPVPILSIHGLDDEIAPFDGGLIEGAGDLVFLSAVDTLEFWRGKNSCNGPLERENFGSEAWCDVDRNCQDDAQTIMCSVSGGSGSGSYNHIIYRNSAGLDLAELSWEFFQLFTLGGSPGFQINAGLNDAWVSADAPLQGFFITVFEVLEAVFLSWFTFDSVPPDDGVAAVFGAADQRWVTGLGLYSGNSVTISVELTSGGVFNASVPLATQQLAYGTITIVFNSCTEAILTYNFPSVGLSGQMTLTRVLPDNVALCEVLNGS
jgi:polyhydroxybutyrate depolymerase